jgi:hypothetical protein
MGQKATVLEVASHSSPGKFYRVHVGPDGPIFCDCPAHRFTKGKPAGQRPDCKHMRILREDGVALATARVVAASVVPASAVFTPPKQMDSRIRFIEVQEETNEGTWASVSDLRRFNNLEVN